MPKSLQTSRKSKSPVQKPDYKPPQRVLNDSNVDQTDLVLANPQRATPAGISKLQRQYGNRTVLKVIGTNRTPAIQRQMEDEGLTGAEPIEGNPMEETYQPVTLEEGETSEWGEFDGLLDSDINPRLFIDGGKTGTATVHWGGGSGARGNQGVGSISLVAPVYDSEPAAGAGTDHATAWAWIRPGTGRATVTRSYTGVPVGANNTYYITARAAARIDRHEAEHVNSSRSIHDANITPLETRIAQYTGRDNALKQGTTAAEAIAALQAIIDWNTAITAFRTADTTANTPGGTTDTTDQASADFYFDYGPRSVGNVNYAHYVDTPPGPPP
jgi:hypothetical protein